MNIKRRSNTPDGIMPARIIAGIFILVFIGGSMMNGCVRSHFMKEVIGEARDIEHSIRHIHMLPLHDIGEERARLEERVAALEAKINSGKLGRSALGRAYLALGHLEEAKGHLEAAWRAGDREKDTARALAHTLALLALDGPPEEPVQSMRQPGVRERGMNERYRQPAQLFLRQAGEEHNGETEYIHALLLFGEKAYEEALNRTRAARDLASWLFEAWALESRIFTAQAYAARDKGRDEAAWNHFRRAYLALEKAAEVAPSLARLYTTQASLAQGMMQTEIHGRGLDVTPYFERGLQATGLALKADSRSCEAYRLRSFLYQRMAENERVHGRPPGKFLEQAVQALERVLILCPEDPTSLKQMGRIRFERGLEEQRLGEDPRGSFRKAAEAYDRTIQQAPDYETYNNLGRVLRAHARFEMDRGGAEPTTQWREAVSAFNRALELAPQKVGARNNLGFLYSDQADYAMAHGLDPLGKLDKAIRILRESLGINKRVAANHNLALVFLQRAEFRQKHGQDPQNDCREAIRLFNETLNIRPKWSGPLVGKGMAHFYLATDTWRRGKDPEPQLEAALTTFFEAVIIDPNDPYALNNIGAVFGKRAEIQLGEGKNPIENLGKALEWYNKLLAGTPDFASAINGIADVRFLQASFEMESGLDPASSLEKAVQAVRDARAIQGEHYEPLLIWGRVRTLQARVRAQGGVASGAAFEAAWRTLERARDANPNHPDIYLAMARWSRYSMETLDSQSELDIGSARGRDALVRLLKINPNLAEAGALDGVFHLLEARMRIGSKWEREELEKARLALERALKQNRHLTAEYGSYLTEVVKGLVE